MLEWNRVSTEVPRFLGRVAKCGKECVRCRKCVGVGAAAGNAKNLVKGPEAEFMTVQSWEFSDLRVLFPMFTLQTSFKPKQISCNGTTSPMNQLSRNDHFHMYSISPHLPQFPAVSRTTPLWSLWTCPECIMQLCVSFDVSKEPLEAF